MENGKPLQDKKLAGKECLFDLLIHDLTGPLSIIAVSTNSLLNKPDQYGSLTDQQKRSLDRIARNARKAQTLLQEMIEIFRSEEGLFKKDSFPIERVLKDSLLDVLESAAPHAVENLYQVKTQEEFLGKLKSQGIVIEITGRYGTCHFCHDQQKVQQIFRNLISNALKYRKERVTVSIRGDSDLFITVEDDGAGIPLKEQAVIFERFARLNNKDQGDIQGLGLGLTGVKALVEAMDGEITLLSREGIGSRFTVRIPTLHSD
jgi:two-component system, OmpR family, sensor kinase